MKNVLLVTFHFPPDAAVGAFRCQKFAKYLPEHGWTPHVLTVRERYYEQLDPMRVSDVASVHVTRTRMLPSPLSALMAVRDRILRALGRSGTLQRRREANASMTAEDREERGTGVRAGLRRLLLSLGRLPDDQIGWVPLAVAAALRVCRRNRIEVIVTTSPPHSVHLVGLILKRLTGIRWVADFRDPWVGNPAKPLSYRTGVSDRIDSSLERAVVRKADQITVLTDRMGVSFGSRYPDQAAAKFLTIHNGFDGDDFSAVEPVLRDGIFTISHVGSLYHRRSPRVFLSSVASLIQQGKIPRSAVRIVFVGTNADGHQPQLLGESLGLGDLIHVSGPVTHREALACMLRADLLCLFVQGWPEQIPAKAFEYVATGTPILAIAGEGAAADFITKAGGTVVPDEPWAIEDAVYQHYVRFSSRHQDAGRVHPWAREEVRRYDRRVLAGQLAALLQERTS